MSEFRTAEPAFSPSGREIAFDQGTPGQGPGYLGRGLGIMSASGGGAHDLLTLSGHNPFKNGEIPPTPAWTPDGKEIVFASYDRQRDDAAEGLYTINLHTLHLTKVTSFSIYSDQCASYPSWVAPLTLCTVPKLKGQTLAAAKRLVMLAGCTVGKVTGPKKNRSKLHVVNQKPAANKNVVLGTKVNIQIR